MRSRARSSEAALSLRVYQRLVILEGEGFFHGEKMPDLRKYRCKACGTVFKLLMESMECDDEVRCPRCLAYLSMLDEVALEMVTVKNKTKEMSDE
jgi:DNA-directed RNA polymerase subunit RPC12/RpoP